MKDHIDPHSLDDPGFQKLLVACLEQLERGETLDREALLKKHQEHAEALSEFLDNQQMLYAIASGLRDSLGRLSSMPVAHSGFAKTMDSKSRDNDFSVGESIRYIGEYEILSEVARGGMGIVLKARQQSLHRVVALKMILAGRLADTADVERFRREAQAAGRLKHPNIVPVHEIGEYEGRHYFTMDFVDGRSLSDLIRESALPPRRSGKIVRAVAEAVQFAHENGTLHRDLKPANILLDQEDMPHITDFGLAKVLDGIDDDSRSELTASGQILGTPSYMSPEQAEGKPNLVGPASDIYSLGAILYACLTGRAPFVADSPVDTLLQVLRNDPVSPRVLNPKVPRDLETICLKCLLKEPQRRYRTAQDLADDLNNFFEGRPVVARPVGPISKTIRWCRRNRTVAALLSLLFVSLATGTIISAVYANAANRHATRELSQRKDAVNARREAETERDAANEARQVAVERGEKLRRQLYVAHMAQAQRDWEEGNIPHLKTLLEQHVPQPGEEDLRGFEWRYLNNLLRSSRLTIDFESKCWGSVCDPNGQWIATIGPHRVAVHHLDTGDLMAQFAVEPPGLQSLAVDSMGRFLAGGNTTLHLWDMETQQLIWKIISPDSIRDMTFTQDGRSLVALYTKHDSRNGVVRVYEVASSETLSTIELPRFVPAMVVDPDGRRIYYTDDGGYLNCRDIATGETLWQTYGFHGGSRMAIDPTGETIACISSDEIVMIDAKSGERSSLLSNLSTSVDTLCFDHSGGRLAIGGDARTAFVINLETHEIEHALRGHENALFSVHFRPGYKQVVSTELEGQTKVWDLEPPQGMIQIPVKSTNTYLTDAAIAPDGQWMATAHGVPWKQTFPGYVQFWDLERLQAGPVLSGHEGGVFGIDVNTDGQILVSAGGDGLAILWDLETSTQLATFDAGNPLRSVDLSQTGQYLAAGTQNGQVIVWDVNTQELRQSFQLRHQILSVDFSPDEKFVAACDGAGFRILELATNSVILESDQRDTMSLAFNHAGDRLAVGSLGRVRLYESQSWQLESDWAAHNPPVNGLAFSADDRVLSTRASDGQVKLWDLLTGQSVLTFEGNSFRRNHRNPPLVSPDDSLMLAGIDGQGLELWNTREQEPLVPRIDPQYFKERGSRHARNQRWPEALDAYERAIAAGTENPWHVVAAAELGVMVDDPDRARELCRKAAELSEVYEDQNINLAGRLVRASQLMPGVEIDLEKSISIAFRLWEKSKNYEGLALLLTLSRAERDEELLAAASEILPSLEDAKSRTTALHLRAVSEYRLGMLEEANATLDRATQQFSNGIPPIGRGRSLHSDYFDSFVMAQVSQREANDLALKKLDDALEMDPDSIELLAYRGEFHRRWHRWDKAYADYRRAAELRPEETQYFEYAAITALLAGKRESCAELTTELIRRAQQPNGVDAAWAAGRIAALATPDIEITDELIEAVAKSCETQPRHWWRRMALAGLLHRVGRHVESSQQLDRIDRFNLKWQDHAATLLWRTLVLLAQNDSNAAQESFLQASQRIENQMQPAGVVFQGQFTIAELFLLREEARELLDAATPPATDESHGNPHLQQLAELNRQLQQSPDDYEITIKTIDLLMQLQHWEAALALVDRAMEIRPDDGWRPAQGLMLAMILQKGQEIKTYTDFCLNILAREKAWGNVKAQAALALGLRPDQVPSDERLEEASRAINKDRDDWYGKMPLVLALLRTGQFEEFQQQLKTLESSGSLQTQAISLLMETIAAQQSGRHDEARRKFQLASPIVNALPKGFVSEYRHQLIALVLAREVEQRLGPSPSDGQTEEFLRELIKP